MKQLTLLVAIVASCCLCIQATDFNADDVLVREPRMAEPTVESVSEESFVDDVEKAIPIAAKMLDEMNQDSEVSESRTGLQLLPHILNPALSLLLKIFASIRTNCAYTPQNLPIITNSPDTLTCARSCRATPSCTHFTQNNTDFTCRRTALISISLIANINLLPTSAKCNCGYIIERATPPSLLSLSLLIGANIL